MADLNKLKQYAAEVGCAFLENEPMHLHTSFKIGGPAELFLIPSSAEILSSIIAACTRWEIPYLVLGNGSNLLVADSGIRGAVISLSGGFSELEMVGANEIKCGAGVKLSRLCTFALEHSLTGLEFAWGIPGTAGGAAFMNAGAYDGEMKNLLISCEHIAADGTPGMLEADALDLSYRHSAYHDNGGIITSLLLRCAPGDPDTIRAHMDRLLDRRRTKQPLEYPSAGSVFKRPKDNFAGTLIEKCGLKGLRHGGAMVSEKHAGFIINAENATASDVKILIEKIKQEVFLQTGIQLECEIRMV